MQSNSNSISKRHLAVGQDANVVRTTFKNRRSLAPGIGVLFVALLAMLTVQLFRAGHTRSLPLLLAEVVAFTALPWIAYSILCFTLKTNSRLSFSKTSIIGFQLGALLVALLVVLWHFVIRQFGYGDANEILALLTIQSVGWYLAVFSKVPGFEKVSSILSGALVFFVCCIADDRRIFLVAALFTFVGLWWLLGQYWSRLESKAIDGDSRFLKLHGSAVSLTMLVVLLVAGIAAVVPFTQNGVSVAGFMPFSGGEKGSENEFAISGIGDGNMLTGGSNATTTGAVESDQFIEDDKPSLYDITSDRYEGPIVKKRRNNKAISLTGIAQQMHEAKKSEQAGRTFRTMRDSDATTDLELEDRITKALFFVEGSVPARFAINNFSQFDGWDWSAGPKDSEAERPRIVLNKRNGTPVFRIAQGIASYLTGQRIHRAKIMRLDTKTIPSPALLQKWHIPLVDKLELFRWGDTGLVEMDGESIPAHAIIDLQSLVPNYHLLRESKNLQQITSTNSSQRKPAGSNDSRFLQIPGNVSKPAIEMLADQWTAGVKPGWMQVESIVNHLRNDFNLNPNWKSDDQVDDSVNHFLDQGGGPSYMFATACTLALRSAGYKTRVASGFLVQKEDYDSRARQSVVTASNLHMWPEVCIDGKFWIPVEPTPGCPIPYSTQTLWQWITTKAAMTWNWFLSNPLTAALFVASVSLAIVFRAEWITSLMFGWWCLVRIFWPRGLLKATRQLIDLRFWFSGNRRPASQTINAWYTRVEANATATFFRLWNAENYSDRAARASRQELVLTCHQTLNSLSLKRIRNFHTVANPPVRHDTETWKYDA